MIGPVSENRLDLPSVLEVVRQVTSDVVALDSLKVDQDGHWPLQGIRTLQAKGLGGLVVPEANGGLGHGHYALARVCEILGRECPSTALCFGMHCVGSAVIAAKATQQLTDEFLDPICRGEHITTLALSEPGTGSHFYLPQTELSYNSNGAYHVNGTKSFVTNGGFANSYVISTVAADPTAPPGQFSCIVVREGTHGMKWGEKWQGLGMRGNSSRIVELQDVQIPCDHLLGEDGDQIWYIFQVVAPYFLAAMAGTYLGIAASAFDEAKYHLARRTYSHNASGLEDVAVLQHRLGSLWAVVERTRRLIYYAGTEADAGRANSLVALCSAKAEVAECAVTVANEAMTLTGGIGYRENSRLGRLLRDARAAHVMSPTTDILRTWAGRVLLGQPMLGD